jgi:hypothetical protein
VVLGGALLLLTGGLGDVSLRWAGPSVAILLGILIVVAARPERPAKVESSVDESPATEKT